MVPLSEVPGLVDSLRVTAERPDMRFRNRDVRFAFVGLAGSGGTGSVIGEGGRKDVVPDLPLSGRESCDRLRANENLLRLLDSIDLRDSVEPTEGSRLLAAVAELSLAFDDEAEDSTFSSGWIKVGVSLNS